MPRAKTCMKTSKKGTKTNAGGPQAAGVCFQAKGVERKVFNDEPLARCGFFAHAAGLVLLAAATRTRIVTTGLRQLALHGAVISLRIGADTGAIEDNLAGHLRRRSGAGLKRLRLLDLELGDELDHVGLDVHHQVHKEV